MIVGEPPGLISAMLLPATSVVTLVANVDASSRHTLAAGPSNPEGAGVSSKRFRNASEDGLSMSGAGLFREGANARFCVATDAMALDEDRRARGGRLPRDSGPTLRRLMRTSDRKGQEAQSENDEARDVPPQVLRQTVVQDAEPGEHLPEQPAVEAVRDACGRPSALRPAAVVETEIDHLDQCVNPGEDPDTPQLGNEDRLHHARFAEGVEHIDNEPEEKRQRQEDGAYTRQAFGRQPTAPIVDCFRGGSETRNWWYHATAK